MKCPSWKREFDFGSLLKVKGELINSASPERLSHETGNSEAKILNKFPNLTWRITEGIFNLKNIFNFKKNILESSKHLGMTIMAFQAFGGTYHLRSGSASLIGCIRTGL